MIETVTYKGPLVTDTNIPGERKCDGIIPAHPGCCRLSRGRWLIVAATLDPRGWDSNHSIIYQIRDGEPDGPIVKEGILAPAQEGWDPFGRGDSFTKRLGMAVPFGVPKGAVGADGVPLPGANVFVVKWYRRPFLWKDGKVVSTQDKHNPGAWPDGPEVSQRTLRIEWVQIRLNESEDDLEVLSPPQTMRQTGYESDEEFCSLGPGRQMNHSMVPPVPTDASCLEWVEFDSFGAVVGGAFGASAAPVRFRFNTDSNLYEWAETGQTLGVPGIRMGESSIVRRESDWLIAFRGASPDGRVVWFQTDDPFTEMSEPAFTPFFPGPRHVYMCPDGVVRILGNDLDGHSWRDPLCIWDVDPQTFELKNRHVVVDLQESGFPFAQPGADMSKLCPSRGRRQLIIFRAITLRQTAEPAKGPPVTAEDHAAAGVHYAEIRYDEPAEEAWSFAETGSLVVGPSALKP